MRTPQVLVAAALAMLGLAGCSRHKSDDQAPPADTEVAPTPVLVPPPPVPPPPAPKPEAPKRVADLPPPAPEPAPDQQVQDDAAATGMTARLGEDGDAEMGGNNASGNSD